MLSISLWNYLNTLAYRKVCSPQKVKFLWYVISWRKKILKILTSYKIKLPRKFNFKKWISMISNFLGKTDIFLRRNCGNFWQNLPTFLPRSSYHPGCQDGVEIWTLLFILGKFGRFWVSFKGSPPLSLRKIVLHIKKFPPFWPSL